MAIQEAFTRFIDSVIYFLPNLVGAAILLAFGWIFGLVMGRVTKEIFIKLKVDEYIARGKKPVFKLSSIFSVIFTWAVYLIFIREAVNVLALPTLVEVMGMILAFLPGLIGLIIVVIVGYAVGEYIRDQIEESGVTYSEIISKIMFFLIIYVSIAVALPLVGIDTFLINAILLVSVGTVGLGISIAIGLGLKDTIAEMSKKYKKKFK